MSVIFKGELECENDGRWLAEVVELPGVLAYGATEDEAIARVQALALRVVADRLEHDEAGRDWTSPSRLHEPMAQHASSACARGAAAQRVGRQAPDRLSQSPVAPVGQASAQPHTKAAHYIRKVMAGTRRAQTLRRRQSPCRIRRYSRRSAPRTACSSDRSWDGTSTNVNAKTG